jgi:hypothetical protein
MCWNLLFVSVRERSSAKYIILDESVDILILKATSCGGAVKLGNHCSKHQDHPDACDIYHVLCSCLFIQI